MNIIQGCILDNYSRIKEVSGSLKIDHVQKNSILEGAWRGRKISIVAKLKTPLYNLQNVLFDMEYTLQKIDSFPLLCHPLLINKYRNIFACSSPVESSNENFQETDIHRGKRKCESQDQVDDHPIKKRSYSKTISFAISDEVRILMHDLEFYVKRLDPTQKIKQEFNIQPFLNQYKESKKTQEELKTALLRLYGEARKKQISNDGNEAEIAELMKMENIQKVVFTESQFRGLLLTLGLEVNKIPTDTALSYILKTTIKLKQLTTNQRILLSYKIIEDEVLEKELPKFLKEIFPPVAYCKEEPSNIKTPLP